MSYYGWYSIIKREIYYNLILEIFLELLTSNTTYKFLDTDLYINAMEKRSIVWFTVA